MINPPLYPTQDLPSQDPFEGAWATISLWLEVEPYRTSKELLQRLQAESPVKIPDGQLRTLQRRVKAWRAAEARRPVFAGELDVTA